MQVGTYPTRNFAQSCYSRRKRRGAGHFCLPLHVAMQLGLSLQPHNTVARRIVSEDPTRRAELDFGFLLIVCTEQIFTAVTQFLRTELRRVLSDTQTSQQMAECNPCVAARVGR